MISNTLVVPRHLYADAIKVVTDSCCPDDRAYLIDKDGRVHPFKVMTKLPRPEDPGYISITGDNEHDVD